MKSGCPHSHVSVCVSSPIPCETVFNLSQYSMGCRVQEQLTNVPSVLIERKWNSACGCSFVFRLWNLISDSSANQVLVVGMTFVKAYTPKDLRLSPDELFISEDQRSRVHLNEGLGRRVAQLLEMVVRVLPCSL